MKDQTFLNNLIDFKDLRVSSRNQLIDGQFKSRDSFQSKLSASAAELDIDIHNNDKILKNFKELRQQLKQSTKSNQKLRSKLQEKQAQIDRLKINERDFITSNHQLKNQIGHLKHSNQDLKAKLQLLKNMTKNSNQAEEEIQFLKITINDLKGKISNLEAQRNKILQISILQKVEIEQKVKKYQAKKMSDIHYLQDMEIQLSKSKERCIKLENQLKKMQIRYDQQIYNKQWGHGNFEKQHLQEQLRQVQTQNQQLLQKHKKQKQRRNNLQKRVLQLEQTTGLWIVKAETFQSQNKNIQKRCKQVVKKMQQLKQQSNRKISEVLTLQQKFAKSVAISQQLISRVKRQMYGDVVALAKSCQFKLGKLKQQKQGFFKNNQTQQLRKSASDLRARSKSKQKIKINQQKQYDNTQLKPSLVNLRDKFDQCIVIRSVTQTGEQTTQKIKSMIPSHSDSNRSMNPLSQIENIELKIKRQRDEMEKKIRQKMLYRKLQVAHSPQKHQLRQDYFKLFQN